jgi:hypothetical protein
MLRRDFETFFFGTAMGQSLTCWAPAAAGTRLLAKVYDFSKTSAADMKP